MKYKRNWVFECTADVYFEDGSCCVAEVQTNNKGRLNYIRIDGKAYAVNDANLDELGIASIHFQTPALVIR
ncbi:hypothetical protein J5I95_13760 [Candidatus Poribacteria bacterium]|nr:hypothetical protein [Candidatus Poribacteria bacterium]